MLSPYSHDSGASRIFPKGKGANPRGAPTYYLANIPPKLHENEDIGGGGPRSAIALNKAHGLVFFLQVTFSNKLKGSTHGSHRLHTNIDLRPYNQFSKISRDIF